MLGVVILRVRVVRFDLLMRRSVVLIVLLVIRLIRVLLRSVVRMFWCVGTLLSDIVLRVRGRCLECR